MAHALPVSEITDRSRHSAASALETPVESLAEVGPVRAQQLRAATVATLGDLLDYFPRTYQFENEEKPISMLRDGEVGVARGEVTAVNYFAGRGKARFEATLSEGNQRLSLVFFNGAYLRRKIHPGLILRVRGEVARFRGLPQMTNPKWEIVERETEAVANSRLRPVYSASGKLTSETIERIVAANLERGLPAVAEWFAPSLLAQNKLPARAEAYRAIHQPRDMNEARDARRRLVYDELMTLQLGIALSHRQASARLSAPVLRIDKTLDQRIRARFPFDLTPAQEAALWQIVADLKSGQPMKRLLQGDVGSGKTAVAAYAMLMTVANKMQAALLAPTEVLAEQHFLTLNDFLSKSQVNVELLTGRTRRQSGGSIIRDLAEGRTNIVVGTQALLSEGVEFANLGLVVVDEQHRLGVLQRATLTGKGLCPHYLVMTATPIPRTLALSYFADFEVSEIDQLPPGRQPIETRWLRQFQADEAYDFIRAQVSAGHQAYIVVPRVHDDDGGAGGAEDAKSVKTQFERLSRGRLASLRLAPLHGQMSPDEKQATMLAFRQGRIDVLVATTVIEVGIDVPNATVILIDGAESFGLSQLHQLRGRVGRGSDVSHCILLSDADTPDAQERLLALTRTASGFEIAERDLKLRGPGEFFGTRQHGLPQFKLADVRGEHDLLLIAREDARRLLTDDPRLAKPHHAALKSHLAKQFADSLNLAQIG